MLLFGQIIMMMTSKKRQSEDEEGEGDDSNTIKKIKTTTRVCMWDNPLSNVLMDILINLLMPQGVPLSLCGIVGDYSGFGILCTVGGPPDMRPHLHDRFCPGCKVHFSFLLFSLAH